MKALILTFALAASANLTAHATPHFESVDAALAQAKRTHTPVLIDFQAPWCYSCYYMASHVLTGKQWQAVEAQSVIVELDADSPDGAQWMKKLGVRALPSYVVLDENGDEMGRILGEQAREKFYPAIESILATGKTLEQLKTKAAGGSIEDLAAVLGSFQARSQGQEGLDWYASLAADVRDRAAKDPALALALERLNLKRAEEAKDDLMVIATAQRILAADIGCDRPYVVDALVAASGKLPLVEQLAVLKAQREGLERMLREQVFIATPACADQRSSVLSMADLNAALSDSAGEIAVLNRAIEATQKQLGDNYATDRTMADNLRVYLARAKRQAELDILLPKLIAAFPDDYVYAYRHANNLSASGKYAAALPFYEQAADLAYGANRLAVATARVKALKALQRDAEAERVAAEALQQNGAWFPEQVSLLKAALKS